MNLATRIKSLRIVKGLKQVEVARALGTSTANVSRWESGSQPSYENIQSLADFYGKSVDELLFAAAVELNQEIRIIGLVEAGSWHPSIEFDNSEKYAVPAPNAHKFNKTFGLEVSGDSMDLYYPDGTILICRLLADMDRDLRQHDHVIAVCHDGGDVEATCKELVLDRSGKPWLWPRSRSPEHQQPIRGTLDDNPEDHREAIVYAVVVGAIIDRN